LAVSRVATARAVARRCGVSRLADVTGLDRIGLPVWQAIRPWGRSLSVHQGKGLTAAAAQLGACMEAIECSHAEAWAPPLRQARWTDLSAAERAAAIDDFAIRRGHAGVGDAMDWAAAERIGGGTVWVPGAAVSLDLTFAGQPGVTRSSNGQGAGFDTDFASLKALCEVIERDAVGDWLANRSVFTRGVDEIDLAGIDFTWFHDLAARCATLGIAVRAYALPAVIPMPVIAVELHDASGEAAGHPHSVGTAAHPDAETALQSALTEAIQARLTVIAGARDDLTLTSAEARPPTFGLAIARSDAERSHPRESGGPSPELRRRAPAFAAAVALDATSHFHAAVTALAAAGYDQVARLILSPAECPVVTVKILVPGLGETGRARRAPA
jgi:ribosomal protein S12 methylthiotransferase accessory factor